MIARMQRRDEVRDIARLHVQTVTDAESHARSRPRAAETRPRSRLTHHITVHPDVLRTALRLADGDASRLQIISATEVRVR